MPTLTTILAYTLFKISENKMITLHIYSNPIESCFAYNLNTNEKKLVQTKYDKTLNLSLDF